MTHLTKERLEAALKALRLCPFGNRSHREDTFEINKIITEALKALIDAKTAPTWQSIETAPKDGRKFDAWNGLHRLINISWRKPRKMKIHGMMTDHFNLGMVMDIRFVLHIGNYLPHRRKANDLSF